MSAPYITGTAHPSFHAHPELVSPATDGNKIPEHETTNSPERPLGRPRGHSNAHAHHKSPLSSNSSQPSVNSSALPSKTSLDGTTPHGTNHNAGVHSGTRYPSTQQLPTRLEAQLGPTASHHSGSNNSHISHNVNLESSTSNKNVGDSARPFNQGRRPTLRSALLDEREAVVPPLNAGSNTDFPRNRKESVANSILLKQMKQQNHSTSTFGSSNPQFRHLSSMEVTQIDANLMYRFTLNLKHAKVRDRWLQWSFQRDCDAKPVLMYVILLLAAVTTIYGAISSGLQQQDWQDTLASGGSVGIFLLCRVSG